MLHSGSGYKTLVISFLVAALTIVSLQNPSLVAAKIYTVTPANNLQTAINQLKPGDTLVLTPGKYHEEIVIEDLHLINHIGEANKNSQLFTGSGSSGLQIRNHSHHITVCQVSVWTGRNGS